MLLPHGQFCWLQAQDVAKLCFPEGIVWPKRPNYGFTRTALSVKVELVGLPGFEPGTKGFTFPKRFRPAWTISSPSVVRLPVGCGTL